MTPSVALRSWDVALVFLLNVSNAHVVFLSFDSELLYLQHGLLSPAGFTKTLDHI